MSDCYSTCWAPENKLLQVFLFPEIRPRHYSDDVQLYVFNTLCLIYIFLLFNLQWLYAYKHKTKAVGTNSFAWTGGGEKKPPSILDLAIFFDRQKLESFQN